MFPLGLSLSWPQLLLRLSLCLISGPGPPRGGTPAVAERRLMAMGTLLEIRVEAADRQAALAASEKAVREIARIEDLLSTWKPGGSIDRLNRARPGEPVEIGCEATALLEEVRTWSARTAGAFDPTVAPLVRAWNLRGTGRVPTAGEIARALAAVGPGSFSVNADRGEATRLKSAAGIDEGAWGKGHALDRAAEALRAAGIQSGSIDLGGQILVLGGSEVDVADPDDRGRAAASLRIENASVSTSGNSQRGLMVEGRRIGHLLDPHTGVPAADFGSATAIAPSGLVADVLSTAFFVLGPEKGLALSERLRREGFQNEALFLLAARGGARSVSSPGLKKFLLRGGAP